MCDVRAGRVDGAVPLQDVQRHVELRFVGGRSPDEFALRVSRDDGAVCQGESVERAERVAVPQHWKDTNREKNVTPKKKKKEKGQE